MSLIYAVGYATIVLCVIHGLGPLVASAFKAITPKRRIDADPWEK